MDWHEEVLDKRGLEAVRRLAPVLRGGFYLAGGTALGLRLGHRKSLDLDFFSHDRTLDRADRAALFGSLKASGAAEALEEKDGTMHLRLEDTEVSLFHYPYRLLERVSEWNGLEIASIEDIAAMKLGAAAGRGLRKDFIDLYFVCRNRTVAEAICWAGKKFPDHPNFSAQAAKALVYFEDAEKDPMPRMLKPVKWGEIKSFFKKEVPKLFR